MTVAVDLPGHGETRAAEAATIEDCGAKVAALLDARDVAPAVLMGHSLGCRVVLDAASLAPDRWPASAR